LFQRRANQSAHTIVFAPVKSRALKSGIRPSGFFFRLFPSAPDIIEFGACVKPSDAAVRERVFTEAERAYCESRGAVAAQHYAALRGKNSAEGAADGWSGGIGWRNVEVS
jgi:hypothetical protein